MHLDDLRRTVAASAPGEWEVFVCGGYGAGPSFLERHGIATSGDDGWMLDVDAHYLRAAYKPNVSIGLAFGMPSGDRADEVPVHWPKSAFPDPKVSADWADVFWNGMLVSRELMLTVDGGRGILPAGKPALTPHDPADMLDAEVFAETVTPWQYHLARLIHAFERDPKTYDEMLRRAHVVVLDDTDEADR